MKYSRYINFIPLLIIFLSCDKADDGYSPEKMDEEEEVYYKGTFNIVTTSANNCGFVLNIDTDFDGYSDLKAKPINPPDSVYRHLELELQYELLLDSFYCHISGPVVGPRDRALVKLNIIDIKE